jgi:hypothetical protein
MRPPRSRLEPPNTVDRESQSVRWIVDAEECLYDVILRYSSPLGMFENRTCHCERFLRSNLAPSTSEITTSHTTLLAMTTF